MIAGKQIQDSVSGPYWAINDNNYTPSDRVTGRTSPSHLHVTINPLAFLFGG